MTKIPKKQEDSFKRWKCSFLRKLLLFYLSFLKNNREEIKNFKKSLDEELEFATKTAKFFSENYIKELKEMWEKEYKIAIDVKNVKKKLKIIFKKVNKIIIENDIDK